MRNKVVDNLFETCPNGWLFYGILSIDIPNKRSFRKRMTIKYYFLLSRKTIHESPVASSSPDTRSRDLEAKSLWSKLSRTRQQTVDRSMMEWNRTWCVEKYQLRNPWHEDARGWKQKLRQHPTVAASYRNTLPVQTFEPRLFLTQYSLWAVRSRSPSRNLVSWVF